MLFKLAWTHSPEARDKTIKQLEKTREALLLSEQHLQRANIKSQDLTVKKLTYNNPTMKKEFDNQKKSNS